MHRIGSAVVLSATDLTKHLACPHLTTLDLAVAQGRLPRPAVGVDEQLQLIVDKGIAHEIRYLEALRSRYSRVVEIDPGVDRATASAQTVAAMADGADVVYQATFTDGQWVGIADFLLRRGDRSSRWGPWSYDIADTKLARRLKVPALLQMAGYAEHLTEIQGVAPRWLVVVTGDRAEHPWRLLDVAAYARRARDRLRDAVADEPATEPVPVPYCTQCRWQQHCAGQWSAAEDLSLVAGMRTAHRQALREGGIVTVRQLALADPGELDMLSPTVRDRLSAQARLQVAEADRGRPHYRLLPPASGRGLLRLPAPHPGDVYLDFEGDPFAADGAGREYLAGLGDRLGLFDSWWAHDEQQEARLVEALLARLVARWQEHPDMHVYHYAAYETTALKRLTGRYGVGEADLDALLRGERFVDLYAVVRHGLQISKPSYSIKKLEDFYWGQVRAGAPAAEDGFVADAMASVVAYERYLAGAAEGSPDEGILASIVEYNRQDVASTLALHDWLEDRRAELVRDLGREPGRPHPGAELAESMDSEQIRAEKELADRLLAAGHGLLAGLVGWHRREDRPEYWEFFARAEMSDDELVDSSATAGRLGPPEHVGDVTAARSGRVTSRIYRYRFPPQECALGAGEVVVDVDTRQGGGTVSAVDPVQGWIDVKRGVTKDPAVPRAFGPSQPINKQVLKGALMRAADTVLAGPGGLPWRLLDRQVPADLALQPGESPAEAVVRVGQSLHGQVLAVQGPPGSGKTYAGCQLIRALLDSGRTVGVTAQSHAVIRNLLDEVARPALHKVSTEEAAAGASPDAAGVSTTTSNATVQQALADGQARLVGGTAWLWARPELAEAVDVLVIDEAGQFSLANAVAVAGAATSLVLLGDPQQLSQPTKAAHPHGSGVSALQHLIGDAAVIPPDRGLFLDRTWRMHPDIADYVSDLSYDGRLTSAPGRDRQELAAPGALTGAGLRWVPVPHLGNVAESVEEAAVVSTLVRQLLAGQWSDETGRRHPLTEADVLVIAPYNAQVRLLLSVLPEGVRVGTVDRFQGRQAPVVIYSMASSSAHDAPRGVNFLFDVHRLTVAVSRAKALTVIVGSPALLEAPVHDPEQLRAVNALCEYVDRAQQVRVL